MQILSEEKKERFSVDYLLLCPEFEANEMNFEDSFLFLILAGS